MTERSAAAWPDIIEGIGVLFLWIVIVIRAGPALRQPNQRTMWVAVLCGAVAMSLRIGPVYSRAVQATGISLGDYRDITADVIGLVAAAAIFAFVLNVVGRHRYSRLAYASAVIVAATLLLIDRYFDARTANGLTQHSTAGNVYWLILLTYHLIANFWCAYICWRCAPSAQSPSLKAALVIFSAGTGAAGVLMVLSLIHYTTRLDAIAYLFPIAQGAEAFLYGLGTAVPLIAPALRARQETRWLARIYPLWRDLTNNVEGITLHNPSTYLSYLALSRVGRRQSLYRRVIEAQDAILVLDRYLQPGDRDRACRFVHEHGVDTADVDAATTACCISAALRRKSASRATTPAPTAASRWETKLDAEAAYISRVAFYYRSPLPGDFLASHADTESGARLKSSK